MTNSERDMILRLGVDADSDDPYTVAVGESYYVRAGVEKSAVNGAMLEHPVCRTCGATVPSGTLFAHEKAEHPRPVTPAPELRACRVPACIDRHSGKHYHDPVRGVVR